MGFFIPIVFSLIAMFMMVVSYEATIGKVKAENRIDTFLKIDTSQSLSSSSFSTMNKEEELEAFLIRLCQTAQSMIINCQECYLSGRTNCPYPTDAFCQSARGVNYNDVNLVWGFLPNNSGDFSDVYSARDKDLNTLTNVNEIPQGIRYLLKREMNLSAFSGYRYVRPQASFGDACAVEGVLSR